MFLAQTRISCRYKSRGENGKLGRGSKMGRGHEVACSALRIQSKAMVFPVVMYGCESWTVKKAERRRINAFELWCWRRLLRVPWTERRSALGFLWKE